MSSPDRHLAEAVIDAVRRTIVHYGLWFSQSVEQFGIDRALEMEREAGDKATAIIIDRLCTTLGIAVEDGLPAPLVHLDSDAAQALLRAMAVNWLAVDGVWFQSVEKREGLAPAKVVNDSCWSVFSPLEATRIKTLGGLEENGGLPALAEALRHRLYASINEQEIVFEDDGALVMRMLKCRVQTARQRKGLTDYPCKSGGVVEYTTFAHTIDKRIVCDCIACPPDPHPEEWVCSWRFTLLE
ncbi:DUF6125 family protein [Magnetospirillum molischianum]|uniref:Cytosolic protein n=1 Tax=Magnetospirillum molischianum DSM 120 TaxID=1150626 RepID=H8FXH9_MAGML|nr:DUF6125 family protein [Magnetospirillum molischianum]CCG43067.1 conserved hypothetical protein [Magnetospirillum molischianum DSM 120]